LKDSVSDSVEKMGLTKTHTAIDEKGVVELADAAGHMHGRRPAHPIGRTLDQGFEGQGRVESTLEATGWGFVGWKQTQRFGQRTEILIDRSKLYRLIPWE